MAAGSATKRRRTGGTDSSLNSTTPSRSRNNANRSRGRPPHGRDGRERPPSLAECFKRRCGEVLDKLSKKDHYNIFLEPVDTREVKDYLDHIKNPMDFTTMRTKLAKQEYNSLGEFRKDLDLIWSNCLLFNGKEPTNIFTKKAIELRRMTEKLIVTTRQSLEQDKETVQRWKEKHRKRRETVAANAAHAAGRSAVSHPHSNPILDRDMRPGTSGDMRDNMLATDYTLEDQNGRTPEQNALAEALRLQYNGATGLFKRSTQNAPFPTYTKPDGSIMSIPIRRYNPAIDHWACPPAYTPDYYSAHDNTTMYYDTLPSSKASNPCTPNRHFEKLLVKDYCQSLFSFVKGMGPTAILEVTELLSPELTLKAQHDMLKSHGLGMREVAKKIKEAKQQSGLGTSLYPSLHQWDADAIIKLADDIEKSNKIRMPIFQRVKNPSKELDGIRGLATMTSKELIKDIEEVPLDVIDYDMPHGVSLATVMEICKIPAVFPGRVTQEDLKALEKMKRQVEVHMMRLGPDVLAKMSNVSKATPGQLHEVQLRSKAQRRNRKAEAERQAAVIAEHYNRILGMSAMANTTADHASQEEEEKKKTAKDRQVAASPMGSPPQTGLKAGVNGTPGQSPPSALAGSRSHLTPQQSSVAPRNLANALSASSNDPTCQNCGTTETLGWRSGPVGNEGPRRLCMSCGVYWQRSGQQRPKSLWSQTSLRSQHSRGSPPNSLVQARSSPGQPRSMSRGTPVPNGVATMAILKRSQPQLRRSPASSTSVARSTQQHAAGMIFDGNSHAQAIQNNLRLPNSVQAATSQLLRNQNNLTMNLQGHQNRFINKGLPQPNILTFQHQQGRQSTGMPGLNRAINAAAVGNGSNALSSISGVPNGVTASMLVQQAAALGAQSQNTSSLMPGVSATVLADQKHSVAPHGIAAQAPGLLGDSSAGQLRHHQNTSKASQMMMNMGSIPGQHLNTQPLLTDIHARSMVQSSTAGNTMMQFSRRDGGLQLPSGSMAGAGLGANVAQYSLPTAPNTTPAVSGIVADPRNAFGSTSVANNVPANSEQMMMESLLFGDAGISGTNANGPPEFDF